MRVDSRLRARLLPLAGMAEDLGLPLFVVGGCVRDGLLGAAAKDMDLSVEGDPLPLARAAVRRWGGSSESFGRFGTVRLFLRGGVRLDLARARAEEYPRPGALPVVRPALIGEDLRRRDFTVNAMARPVTRRGFGELLDPHGGVQDLAARRIRVLHPASFQDDPTRLFRAARYAGRFSFRLESGTAALVREAVHEGRVQHLSRERIRGELLRLLEERDPGPAMTLLKRWDLLSFFHPRFSWPAHAGKAEGTAVRLGLCALALEGDGREFLESLHLERGFCKPLRAALQAASERMAPRAALGAEAEAALSGMFPGRPRTAFQPRLLGGADLGRAGLPPGTRYRLWLDAAARAQWEGEFSTHAQALQWLDRRLAATKAL